MGDPKLFGQTLSNLEALYLMQASYDEPKTLADLQKCLSGFSTMFLPLSTIFSSYQTPTDYAFSILNSSRAIVCYRGTEGYKAWISDALVRDRSTDKQRDGVEEGFWNFYNDFSKWATQRVVDACTNGVPVTLIGHSRGGACASVTALELARAGIKVDQVVTAGEPMWCLEEVAEEYNAMGIPSVRMYTSYDIVPTTPPRILGYVHAAPGTEIYTPYWTPYPPLLTLGRFLRGCHDHKTQTYIKYTHGGA